MLMKDYYDEPTIPSSYSTRKDAGSRSTRQAVPNIASRYISEEEGMRVIAPDERD